MLINPNEWLKFCKVPIKGIIHIGAHECEEQGYYNNIGLTKDKVIWIEAMDDKVKIYKEQGYNIYNITVSDKDNEKVTFSITNNGQSSSILELGTHLIHHPHIHVVKKEEKNTTTMKTFIESKKINMNNYNFMNLDIQGAELKAIKGMGQYLNYIDYVYAEVNTEYVYKDCGLLNEIDAYLATYGFSRVIINMTEYKWGDAFYVKNKQ